VVIFQALTRNVISAILLAIPMLPAVALADATSRSLKASVETHEQPGFRPDCPSKFGGTTTGTGKSTHMGKVSLKADDCITPMEDHFIFEGVFTLTAANGDTVTGGYKGAFVPADAGSSRYSLSGAKFEITGGTGRFLGAKGIAELKGDQDIATGKGKIEVDGAVSY
jgi:hypothetical protein